MCGVFGVRAPGRSAAYLTYLGLHALQHRGQESAGMAVSDGSTLTIVKDMGLVAHAFDARILAALDGPVAIGHVRYSTSGSSSWQAAQPFYRDAGEQEFAIGHNGNIVNTATLAAESGMLAGTVTSDTDLVAELIYQTLDPDAGVDLAGAMVTVLPRLQGGYAFVAADRTTVVGARDPDGLWPLSLGRLGDDGWVLASEGPAFDTVGAHFVREVAPGEMVVIDENGPRSVFHAEHPAAHLCIFEFVYFSRPDSELYGRSVHQARRRMGELLAEQAPADGDLVMPVPESGVPAAQGFSSRSGLPYVDGFVKNRYIGRTFIAPTPDLRALGVRMKLNAIRRNVAGKRLVVVDDSIVRGTTTRAMVDMLRQAGAAEVHLRISSPPYRNPCFYGLDTGTRSELLAARLEPDEIATFLGVDSLAFLGLDALRAAIGAPGAGFCDACLTGHYPVEVPVELAREVGGERRDDHQPGASATAALRHLA